MRGTTRLPLVAFVLAAGGDAQLARMPAFLNEFAFEQNGGCPSPCVWVCTTEGRLLHQAPMGPSRLRLLWSTAAGSRQSRCRICHCASTRGPR